MTTTRETPTPDFIQSLEHARIEALLAADAPRLLALHAEDYQLITPSGRAFTRERYLDLIASGDLRYLRWEPADMKFRIAKAMAIVRYRATLQLNAGDKPGTPLTCWHTDSWELRGDAWQAVWSQATEIRS